MATLTPQTFVAKWKKTQLTERAAAQSHFIDFCHLLQQPTPTDADPSGEWYAFEKGLTKGNSKGSQGYADVWMKGHFAWEYKRSKANLGKAYEQLQLYREALENPPLLIVCDTLTLEIHTNFTNTVKKVYKLSLDDLLDPKNLDLLRKIFTDPDAFKVPTTTAEVTEQVAREFAQLAELLRKQGIEANQAAHFLIRLLFCLFAEDIGLLPDQLFTRLIETSQKRPKVFVWQLPKLFEAMRSVSFFGTDEILHFNGGLFDDDQMVELDNAGLEILYKVCKLDWSNIEPAVLGTLFERSLDPTKRSQLGAHYTSRADILLIVEPVLMAPLRRQWGEVQAKAAEVVKKRDASTGGQRTKLDKELASLLTNFNDQIASVQVLDPACGSGNFLYVALKQLLGLQKEVAVFAQDVGLPQIIPSAGPQQLHGIELNEYAHELAQATIWIGYIQWLRDNGFGQPPEPILKSLKAILNMDAVLAYDEQGQPVEPEWPKADIIIGNPPFLGGSRLRRELGDKYVENLWQLHTNRVPNGADLVCYWFERTRKLLGDGHIKRAGLLATQGIRGGSNRKVLERITETGTIFMAWSDREWAQEGVAVHVSMIGFDKGEELTKTLDGKPVQSINPDLTSSLNFAQALRLEENANLSFRGDTKGGAFELLPELATKMLKAPLNPNGRPNSEVVVPSVNGLDIAGRRRGLWIVDFGADRSEEEAALYEQPFEYIVQHVKLKRATSRATQPNWWLHERPRPTLRTAIAGLERYIITLAVGKHRFFTWLNPPTLPDQALIVIARNDDYFLGVLHSKVHELWALRQGTSLEDRPRYTPTTTFETFPFPWPPNKEPKGDPKVEAIALAARELVEKRDRWLNPPDLTEEKELKKRTLTSLYNQRPTWLDLAHQKLDKTVLEAYGWPIKLTNEEILEKLLALNLERAAAQGETQLAEQYPTGEEAILEE
ncbi:MAG: DNA methyltransferase [Chloroflexota bacterium]